MSESEHRVAVHEAGHAVLTAVLDAPAPVRIIDPSRGYAENPNCENLSAESNGLILMGGALAEQTAWPCINAMHLWRTDPAYFHDAYYIQRCIGSTLLRAAKDRRATHISVPARQHLLYSWQVRTRAMLAEHWHSVQRVAEALQDVRNLTAADVATLL